MTLGIRRLGQRGEFNIRRHPTGALATGVFGLSGLSALVAIVIGNVIGGLILAAFATYGC